jgi:hypothetical protein
VTAISFVLAPGQNAFFAELADALRTELEDLGVDARIHEGEFPEASDGSVPVLLPPHEYARLAPGRIRRRELRRCICVCAEQPESPWFAANLRLVHAAGAVFDLNRRGAAALRRNGIRAEHLRLGYTRRWDRFSTESPREVDLAFLGSSTPRRDRILASYAERLWRRRAALVISDNRLPNEATTASFLAGEDKLRLLAGSKLLLNLHRGPEPYFEWLRALEAIHCGAVLLSERSADFAPLVPGKHFVSGRAESLPQLAEAILDDSPARVGIAAAAFEFIRSELPMSGPAARLAEAAERLSRIQARPARTVRPAAPRKPRRSAAERLEAILGVAAAPITRIGGQVKELRLRIDDLSRRLDLLDYKLDHGEAPTAQVELETRPEEGQPPRVSVIVPVYDYAHVVREALESVARSTFSGLEVVVVDDGSRDDSVDLLRSWMTESELSAVLVRHPVNRGLPAARNTAIRYARGDYLLMLDADNRIYPHCIERLAAALDGDGEAAFAYGILERFDRSGPIGLRDKFGWSPERLRRGNYIDALALIRRNVLEEVGGYTTDVRLFGWEDYDLWCAIASLGMRATHVREIVGRYRESPEAMTSVIDLSTGTARSVITERHPALFAGAPPKSSTIDRIVRQLV